jgi:hypothetical protein
MSLNWQNPALKPILVLAGVALSAILIGAAVTSHFRAQATQAEAQANEAKGAADASKQQAQAKDAEIAAKDASLDAARNDVARKVAELARLRAAYNAPLVDPIPPEPVLVPTGVADLAPLVRKQDQVIASQSVYITGLEARVSDLTTSRDAWKRSSEDREREAAGLRIALEAQKALTKSALWKGRFQGLALGLAGGYTAGRFNGSR